MGDDDSRFLKKSTKKKEKTVKGNDTKNHHFMPLPEIKSCKSNQAGSITCSPEVNHVNNIYEKPGCSSSFSKYKLLPAIHDKKDSKCSKRTFDSWSIQDEDGIMNSENDILDTIKRMKLGNDYLTSVQPSCFNEGNINLSAYDEDCKPCSSAINLIIRLPNGHRIQHSFSSSNTLNNILEHLSLIMQRKINLDEYVLYTNEVPKRELRNGTSTIVALGIHDKSVLALDFRDFPDGYMN